MAAVTIAEPRSCKLRVRGIIEGMSNQDFSPAEDFVWGSSVRPANPQGMESPAYAGRVRSVSGRSMPLYSRGACLPDLSANNLSSTLKRDSSER